MVAQSPHPTTDNWLRQERERLRPTLMLRAFRPDVAARSPSRAVRTTADAASEEGQS